MSADGLSWTRLTRLNRVVREYVDRGELPGAVFAVARRGGVHVETVGSTALGGDRAMTPDVIFRISSMSKAVAAVVAMTLVEECVLRLDDPVDDLLPELANRRVLRSVDAEVDDTVPARRSITLRDLLTFRLGHGVVMAAPGTYPIQKAMEEAGVAPGFPRSGAPADAWMRGLADLPLLHQPGESWRYHTGSVVLGALLARATGKPLEELFRERVFEPLGMTDTGFWVPPGKRDRLAVSYMRNGQTGGLDVYDPAGDGSEWAEAQELPDAADGLVSTVGDYLMFARMLLGHGKLGGQRLLSRPSVELMTSDQLTPAQKAHEHYLVGPPESHGWGFGVAVTTRRDNTYATPGRYGWDGGLGTFWANDPREEMTGILLTQVASDSPAPPAVGEDFWVTAYRAIDD